MNFKDLKPNHVLYILDKGTVTLSSEKVVSVSLPHADAKMGNMSMVVDVQTDTSTYCMMADSDIAYPLNKVITTDRQNILREVESIKSLSQQRIDNMEQDRQTVTKCNQLIADLDPRQREKQAMEARMSTMESSINQMMQLLKSMQH